MSKDENWVMERQGKKERVEKLRRKVDGESMSDNVVSDQQTMHNRRMTWLKLLRRDNVKKDGSMDGYLNEFE